MTDKYPLPAYACNIWVAGDSLMVAFPGTVTEQGHTIKLPISERGLKTALSILCERSTAQDLRLANRGTPTQWDADAVLAALARSPKMQEHEAAKRKRAEASEFLKELGL